MTTYMLRFNRATGSLDELKEFPNVTAALDAMTEEELKDLRFGDDIEYRITTSENIDTLKSENPDYFVHAV